MPIGANVYNVTGLLNSELVKDLKDLSSMDEEKMVNSLLDILREFNGTMPLLKLNENISFTVGGFGLGAALKECVITTGGSVGTTLSAAMEAELASGFSWHYDGDGYYLSFGVSPKLSYTLYTSPLGIETAVAILLDNSLFNNIELYHQIGFGVDIGAYASVPHNLRFALVLRDIGKKPLSLDAAIGWKDKWGIITLELEAGMRGINNIRDKVDLMKSFNAGMQLSITDFIALNAGINGGYPSFGIEFDIFFLVLMFAYYYQDYGVIYGLAPRDVLALEMAISF